MEILMGFIVSRPAFEGEFVFLDDDGYLVRDNNAFYPIQKHPFRMRNLILKAKYVICIVIQSHNPRKPASPNLTMLVSQGHSLATYNMHFRKHNLWRTFQVLPKRFHCISARINRLSFI